VWAEKAREAERNHLVFLLMGALTAAYAARLGWYGWTIGQLVSNVVFNGLSDPPPALQPAAHRNSLSDRLESLSASA
jgi:hypothetical protein